MLLEGTRVGRQFKGKGGMNRRNTKILTEMQTRRSSLMSTIEKWQID